MLCCQSSIGRCLRASFGASLLLVRLRLLVALRTPLSRPPPPPALRPYFSALLLLSPPVCLLRAHLPSFGTPSSICTHHVLSCPDRRRCSRCRDCSKPISTRPSDVSPYGRRTDGRQGLRIITRATYGRRSITPHRLVRSGLSMHGMW